MGGHPWETTVNTVWPPPPFRHLLLSASRALPEGKVGQSHSLVGVGVTVPSQWATDPSRAVLVLTLPFQGHTLWDDSVQGTKVPARQHCPQARWPNKGSWGAGSGQGPCRKPCQEGRMACEGLWRRTWEGEQCEERNVNRKSRPPPEHSRLGHRQRPLSSREDPAQRALYFYGSVLRAVQRASVRH